MMCEAQAVAAVPPTCEGWVVKRSRTLHSWRPRWLTLWTGPGSREVLEAYPDLRGSHASETFHLGQIRGARSVTEAAFARPHCFVIEYMEDALRQDKYREVGFQAAGDADRERWVAAITNASKRVQAVIVIPGRESGTCIDKAPISRAASSSSTAPAPVTPRSGGASTSSSTGKAPSPCKSSAPSSPGPGETGKASKGGKGGKGGKAGAGGKGKGPPPPLPKQPPPPPGKGRKGGTDGKGEKGGKVGGKGGAPPCPQKGKPAIPKLQLGKGGSSSSSVGNIATNLANAGDKAPKAKSQLPLGRRLSVRDAGDLSTSLCTARGSSTVFDKLYEERASKVHEDVEVLAHVFRAKTPRVPKVKTLGLPGDRQRAILPQREAQNIAIVMRTLPLSSMELVDAIESLEPGPLDDEQVERFAAALPGQNHMKALLADRGPEDTLRDIEKMLLPLARIPQLDGHMKALCIAARLVPQQEAFQKQMSSVQAACKELRSSDTFRAVLGQVLVMFNYVNFGNVDQGRARAFDITTLLRLNEFKAMKGPFPNFHGLHFVVQRLLAEDPNLTITRLIDELGHIKEATRVCLLTIHKGIQSLRIEVNFLESRHDSVSRAFETSKAHQGKVSSSGESSTNTDEEDVTTITKVATSPTPPPSWTSTLPSAEAYARCAVFGRRQRRYAVFRWIRRAVRRTLGPEGDLEPALPVLSIIRPPGAPPPSWLLSSSSESGQGAAAWRRVWVDVRAPGLLCFGEVAGDQRTRQRYIVLSGARVVPTKASTALADGSNQAADLLSSRFQLQTPMMQGLRSPPGSYLQMSWSSEDPKEALRWQATMASLNVTPGSGLLWVQRKSGIWAWRWATVHAGACADEAVGLGALLVWYRTPGEFLRGEHPIGGIRLREGIRANPLTPPNTNGGGRQRSRWDFSFEVAEHREGTESSPATRRVLARFRASSEAELQRWLQALPSSPVPTAAPVECAESAEPQACSSSSVPGVLPGASTKPQACSSSSVPGVLPGASTKPQATSVPPATSEFPATSDDDHQSSDSSLPALVPVVLSARSSRSDNDKNAGKALLETCNSQQGSFAGSAELSTPSTAPSSARLTARSAGPSSGRSVTALTGDCIGDSPSGRKHSSDESDQSTTCTIDTSRTLSTRDTSRTLPSPNGEDSKKRTLSIALEDEDEDGGDPALRKLVRQLRALLERAEESANTMSVQLKDTTNECMVLLKYFGQKSSGTDPGTASDQVHTFFGCIDQLLRMLKTAFEDVKKHNQRNNLSNGSPMDAQLHSGAQMLQSLGFQNSMKRGRRSDGRRAQLEAQRAAKVAVAGLVDRSLDRIGASIIVQRVLLKILNPEGPAGPAPEHESMYDSSEDYDSDGSSHDGFGYE